MTFNDLIFANPLLVKHVRSRLRGQQLLPFVIVIVIIAACILWGVWATDTLKSGAAFIGLLVLQVLLLVVVGTNEVASAVANAKHSGTLDFHRISPQSPVETALGFILGAPLRELVLVLVTLPFSVAAVIMGRPGLSGLLLTLIVLIASALLFHTLAALAGAASVRLRGAGSWVTLLVIILHSSSSLQIGLLTVIPTAAYALDPSTRFPIRDSFFGVHLPIAVLSLLHILPLMALLFIAAVRKMKTDAIPLYSKPQAVVFHAVLAALVLGDATGVTLEGTSGLAPTVVLYALMIAAILLTWVLTPDASGLAKGIRRARKDGLPAPSLWSDHAPNWYALGGFCAITVMAGLWSGLPEALLRQPQGRDFTAVHLLMMLPVVIGAIVSAGSARQFFGIRYGKPGQIYYGLFMFVVWVLPLVIGTILGAASRALFGGDLNLSMSITALSPLAGVGVAGAVGGQQALVPPLVVAVLSPTTAAIIFTVLSVRAEQKAAAAGGNISQPAANAA